MYGDTATCEPFFTEEADEGRGSSGVSVTKDQIYIMLMNNFGYTPEQIGNMTIEQLSLGFKDIDKANPNVINCSSIHEARRFLQEFKGL